MRNVVGCQEDADGRAEGEVDAFAKRYVARCLFGEHRTASE